MLQSINDNEYYCGMYGEYLNCINYDVLTIPCDRTAIFFVFCFVFFVNMKGDMSRSFLSEQFCNTGMSNKFKLAMQKNHSCKLANIFLKNDELLGMARSDKKNKLKSLNCKNETC